MGIERELARDLLAKVRRREATEADLLIIETGQNHNRRAFRLAAQTADRLDTLRVGKRKIQ